MYIPPKLGAVPVPQADECLSSFLIRMAHRHGLSPHTLCHILWPTFEVWTRDIDRCARADFMDAISRRTGLTVSFVEQLTLRPLMQAMTGQVRQHGVSRWILPIGVYHRIRHAYGQRYCPDCLAEAPRHLKRAWRLGHVSVCLVHYRHLEDACHRCDAPFVPHRHDSLLQASCYACGADLTKAPGMKVSASAEAFQQYLDTVRTGTALAADQFSGWHTVLSILARNDERFKNQQGGWFFWRQHERNDLLSAAFLLWQGWPTSFAAWAEQYRLSQAGLNDYRCQSAWLASAIALLPERYSPHRKPRRKWRTSPVRSSRSVKHRAITKNASASAMLNAAYRLLRTKNKLHVPAQ